MTYTRESPFVFKGNGASYYRDALGDIWARGEGSRSWHLSTSGTGKKAFIAAESAESAERDTWHEDGDGFRKGRWTVEVSADRNFVRHDDMGEQVLARADSVRWEHTRMAGDVATDFLAWHAEHCPTQPEEPTGLGAVVEVAGIGYVRNLDGAWWTVTMGLTWSELTARGPVTVLSKGLES